MSTDEQNARLRELEELRNRVAKLEREVQPPANEWQADQFYTAYYATTGFMLGIFGATTSLLFNVVGSLIVGQHPLKLIQVYLTFPLREKALSTEFDTGMALAIGCCLYLGTGMFLGIPVHIILGKFANRAGVISRLIVASIFGLALWVVNFYVILSWLQPLLFGGNWIVEQVPWSVGMLTHLVFAWTMAVVYPLGAYVPYRRQSQQSS